MAVIGGASTNFNQVETNQKAWDILSKINNQEIDSEMWSKASDYAKKDLKRKAIIVVDEIVSELRSVEFNYDLDFSKNLFYYWKGVKDAIESF
jgi:hypothetical protein